MSNTSKSKKGLCQTENEFRENEFRENELRENECRAGAQFDRRLAGNHHNIIDLLRTWPSSGSFVERVREIGLTPRLEKKVVLASRGPAAVPPASRLSEQDEKELAGEVLLLRHRFTRLVFENRFFRQAALSILQNIYLFRQRKIFFGSPVEEQGESERQQALLLFSGNPEETTIPLAKTFQHLIIARVWDRIINQASDSFLESRPFAELHETVEQLNTIRNIYILLSLGLVGKLTANVNAIYRQSITHEDARQIGTFGVARAAYRYHPSMGLRFSTYASHWVNKEIQRQALEGRLIRISSALVEKLSRAARSGNRSEEDEAFAELGRGTARFDDESADAAAADADSGIEALLEKEEMHALLLAAIEASLSGKSADVIMRRYGLGPYLGHEQSVISIAARYGVTRSSIYQLEQSALAKLKGYLLQCLHPPEK